MIKSIIEFIVEKTLKGSRGVVLTDWQIILLRDEITHQITSNLNLHSGLTGPTDSIPRDIS